MPAIIQLNGKSIAIPDDLRTLLDIVVHFGLTPTGLIAEHNGELVQATQFADTPIHSNDIVELIQFMGGGR